ncbi:MAG: phosphate signaling complex protein PhoU [Neomegalonema sp.]|nr:phosphate signaling complex protein PhoU [Neomegalonema sp.]
MALAHRFDLSGGADAAAGMGYEVEAGVSLGREGGSFENDLQTLRARLAEMGGFAEEQLAKALNAVSARDPALARLVVIRDSELDRREAAVEELALRTLAFRQPLAQDLRETVAALKIASTLERIGDLAKNIARRVPALLEEDRPRVDVGIARMGRLAQAQLTDCLDAYGSEDAVKAKDVWARDVELDELYNSLFRELISQMTQSPRLVSQGAHLMFLAKNLERIGDHTTFVAEMTYYIVVGAPLSDERPKGEPLVPLTEADEDLVDTLGARTKF